MEPLKPEDKIRILENVPDAQPDEIAEYERLLAARFERDPDAPQPEAAPREGVDRLAELQRKLFPAR